MPTNEYILTKVERFAQPKMKWSMYQIVLTGFHLTRTIFELYFFFAHRQSKITFHSSIWYEIICNPLNLSTYANKNIHSMSAGAVRDSQTCFRDKTSSVCCVCVCAHSVAEKHYSILYKIKLVNQKIILHFALV